MTNLVGALIGVKKGDGRWHRGDFCARSQKPGFAGLFSQGPPAHAGDLLFHRTCEGQLAELDKWKAVDGLLPSFPSVAKSKTLSPGVDP